MNRIGKGYQKSTLRKFSEHKVNAFLYYAHPRHSEGSLFRILWSP